MQYLTHLTEFNIKKYSQVLRFFLLGANFFYFIYLFIYLVKLCAQVIYADVAK